MPMYTYRCQACTHPFEKLARIAESTQSQPCPACTKVDGTKQVSAPKVFDLRAGGYFATDFA